MPRKRKPKARKHNSRSLLTPNPNVVFRKTVVLDGSEGKVRASFVDRVSYTFYPEAASRSRRFVWFFINSVTLWTLVAFAFSNRFLHVPDYKRIPPAILGIAGTGLLSAFWIHFVLLFQLTYGAYKGRLRDPHFRRYIFFKDTFARIISFTVIVLLLVYHFGLVSDLTAYLQKASTLSGRLIHVVSNSIGFLVSIVSGVVSNAIYTFLRSAWGRSRKRVR